MKPRLLIGIVSGVIPLLAVLAAVFFFSRNSSHPQPSAASIVASSTPTLIKTYMNPT